MSTYSPPELALFRRIIEEVVKSDTGEIRAIEAINLASDLPNCRLGIREAEETVERLVQDKWLVKVHICVCMHDMSLMNPFLHDCSIHEILSLIFWTKTHIYLLL